MLIVKDCYYNAKDNILEVRVKTTFDSITVKFIDISGEQTLTPDSEGNCVIAITNPSVNKGLQILVNSKLYLTFLTVDMNSYNIEHDTKYAEFNGYVGKGLIPTYNAVYIGESTPYTKNYYDEGFFDGLILGQMI